MNLVNLFGTHYSKQEILKRVGDVSQLAGATPMILNSGKARGVHAVDVKTGTGLRFTILPDRAMDIAWADYQGKAIAFISKNGIVGPAYAQENGNVGFLDSFYGGLLTTCGLSHTGAAQEDQGDSLGLHGRIGGIPADDVCVTNDWVGDEYIIRIRGKVRQTRFFKENLVLTREITTSMGANSFHIRDTVENCGFEAEPLLQLYHFNFGFPLVNEHTVLYTSPTEVKPRTPEATAGLAEYRKFLPPTHRFFEHVFYHQIQGKPNGDAYACLFNPTLGAQGLGAYVKFNVQQLPLLVQWKQMGEGDYAVGLEPANHIVEGRAAARKAGTLPFIAPGEIRTFDFEIGIVENEHEINQI